MTRARCWKLQINLDTFNAAYAALDGPQEQSEFLIGLSRGMNGGKVKDDCPDSMAVGFAIGGEMRQEAEGFRMAASINGSKRKSNGNHQTVHHEVDQTVHHPGHPILNPQSTNLVPSTPLPPGKESSPSRARQSAKKKESLPPPEHLLPKLGTIVKDWPRRSDYKGVITPISLLARPADLWSRIEKFVPEADRELAVDCGLVYLDDLDTRERGVAGLIPNVCAMTNFYGEAELWKKMIVRVDEKRAERGQS